MQFLQETTWKELGQMSIPEPQWFCQQLENAPLQVQFHSGKYLCRNDTFLFKTCITETLYFYTLVFSALKNQSCKWRWKSPIACHMLLMQWPAEFQPGRLLPHYRGVRSGELDTHPHTHTLPPTGTAENWLLLSRQEASVAFSAGAGKRRPLSKHPFIWPSLLRLWNSLSHHFKEPSLEGMLSM